MNGLVATTKPEVRPAYETALGRMYCGMAEDVLARNPVSRQKGKIQLVFTSPPFSLNRKKRYGNLQGKEYLRWLAAFAPLLRDYLTKDGSIVIELGNAWESGKPTMSTLPLEALLAFKEKANLHLCQEFICFNPARLPTPVQWVNVERVRVKDAFTRLWWLSPTPNPKADNREVLTEYSDSMKKLLKRGTYNPGRRPSEHNVGEKSFLANNGGAITPNVIVPPFSQMLPDLTEVLCIANTQSQDPYQVYCREQKITPHPARMPLKLALFFIKFLTTPGDRVLDPFAGSNTTGLAAEQAGRKWTSIEADLTYASSSEVRLTAFGNR